MTDSTYMFCRHSFSSSSGETQLLGCMTCLALLTLFFEMENGLKPKMMNESPAAPELLNDMICMCRPNGCHVGCVCLNNEQSCMAACNCEGVLDPLDDNSMCSNYYTLAHYKMLKRKIEICISNIIMGLFNPVF